MLLYEKMKNDLQETRKSLVVDRTDEKVIKVSILRLVVSEFDPKGNHVPDQSDKLVVKKIMDYINGNKLVIEKNVPGSDQYIKADMENAILEFYLPKQLSEDELYEVMAGIAKEHNLTDMSGMRIIKDELEENYQYRYNPKSLKPLALQLFK